MTERSYNQAYEILMSKPVIHSLLENDFYTFSQQMAVLHQFPSTQVHAKFKCRNKADLTPIARFLIQELNRLCCLRFQEDELQYLSNIPFLKPDYIDFLRVFQLNRKNIVVSVFDGELHIDITGTWLHVIMFEVPVLAIVNELYFRHLHHIAQDEPYHYDNPYQECPDKGKEILLDKIYDVAINNCSSKFVLDEKIQKLQFADFGMRRRFSGTWQDYIVEEFKEQLPDNFIGTSNVYLAKKHNIKYIGTMSHQWIMSSQGMSDVAILNSQKYMLDAWVREYRGDLGIALSDTLGFDAFLRDFDKFFAKLYDGVRHDSGCPFEWCEKLIKHYTNLGIDPMTKTAVFSDGLTFPVAYEIFDRFLGKIKMSFGIGTNLTNDCGYEPLQIVIKLTEVNGKPVAKISDSKGKGMCTDDEYLRYLRKEFKIGEYAE